MSSIALKNSRIHVNYHQFDIVQRNLISSQQICTYSLCGMSSSWSPTTTPLKDNKMVIRIPNKIL